MSVAKKKPSDDEAENKEAGHWLRVAVVVELEVPRPQFSPDGRRSRGVMCIVFFELGLLVHAVTEMRNRTTWKMAVVGAKSLVRRSKQLGRV